MKSKILTLLSFFLILAITTQNPATRAETLYVGDLTFPYTVSNGNFSLTLDDDYYLSVVPLKDDSVLSVESKGIQIIPQEVYDIHQRSWHMFYGGRTYNFTIKGELKFLLSSFTLHNALYERIERAFCHYYNGSRIVHFNTTIERNTTVLIHTCDCVNAEIADNEFLKVRVEGPVDSYFYDSVLNRRGTGSIRISGRSLHDWAWDDALYIVLIPHHMSTSHVVIHISVEKESWDILLLAILFGVPCAVAVATYVLLRKKR